MRMYDISNIYFNACMYKMNMFIKSAVLLFLMHRAILTPFLLLLIAMGLDLK